MMTFDILFALMVFVFIGSVTPGPNNLMLLASGLNFGWRRTLPHIAGIVIGFSIMFFLSALGLAKIFDIFPMLHIVLKIASILYLSYLAWKIATSTPLKEGTDQMGKPFTFFQAVLFQWVNPKAWVVAITAIGSYLPASFELSEILVTTLIFACVNLPAISIWALTGTQLQKLFRNAKSLRYFNVSVALILMGSLYPVIF